MATSFASRIGRARIDHFVDAIEADPTRSSRAGMKKIVDRYRRLVKAIEEETPEILMEALEPTFQKSQTYVPVDTGALKASGYLQITNFRGKPRVEIGYGHSGDPSYAAKVHENLEYRHKRPTRAKFLQSALEEDADAIQARITAAYRRRL